MDTGCNMCTTVHYVTTKLVQILSCPVCLLCDRPYTCVLTSDRKLPSGAYNVSVVGCYSPTGLLRDRGTGRIYNYGVYSNMYNRCEGPGEYYEYSNSHLIQYLHNITGNRAP